MLDRVASLVGAQHRAEELARWQLLGDTPLLEARAHVARRIEQGSVLNFRLLVRLLLREALGLRFLKRVSRSALLLQAHSLNTLALGGK